MLINLREWESLRNALSAAKCGTEVTLSDLLSLKFLLGLATDTTLVGWHTSALQLDALGL